MIETMYDIRFGHKEDLVELLMVFTKGFQEVVALGSNKATRTDKYTLNGSEIFYVPMFANIARSRCKAIFAL